MLGRYTPVSSYTYSMNRMSQPEHLQFGGFQATGGTFKRRVGHRERPTRTYKKVELKDLDCCGIIPAIQKLWQNLTTSKANDSERIPLRTQEKKK